MLIQNNQPKICAGYEPIPGYRVETLLGRGGFGEVWSCEAPGGLKKAVKFVHGALDQDRAARELKSLNRIKGVQHPFLLTLDRFDFVDDRLVIITELADQSLESEFARHQARGSCGIPREQLLSHLGDAAEALDYLHQRYGLQHLDIKPGNLLLLGDHVKVADFGLLKDLKEVDCSIVGGLTPVYAPPELFDGRPAMNSDQYSLAVMFQELLTGVRPFNGRTIAQLATQHVHSAPNLSPLLPSDRPVMARALEKNPDRRFGSCREFIAALRQATDRPVRARAQAAGTRGDDTSLGEFSGAANVPVAKVNHLPSIDVGSQAKTSEKHKYALVIGLGGVGAECLRLLAEKTRGYPSRCPLAVRGLLIDTDADAVRTIDFLKSADSPSQLRTLCIPLKKPQQYRELRGKRFRSISRRWIYNVPRTGTTEGLRPLGRLALLDHSEQVDAVLRSAVEELSELGGDASVSVYVVGSLDGGTASGMIFDVLHLVRNALDQHGLESAPVLPMFATGSLQPDAQRALAGHNAACSLAEMRHLINIAHGYPGDDAVGWAPTPAARSPLADAYIVGRGLAGEAKPSPAETICEYIWANSTYGAEILAAARVAGQDSAADRSLSPSVRSVGIVRLGNPGTLEECLHGPMIARQLLSGWIGDQGSSQLQADPADAGEIAAQLAERYRLTGSAVLESCLGQWPAERSERVDAIDTWLSTLPPAVLADPQQFNSMLRKLADATLTRPEQNSRVADIAGIRRELAGRLIDRRMNLALAIAVTDGLDQWVRNCQTQLKTRQPSAASDGDTVRPLSREIAELSERWLWRTACDNANQVFADLALELKAIRAGLAEQDKLFRQCVTGVTQRLQRRGGDSWETMGEAWRTQAEGILRRLHQSVAPSLLSQPVVDRQAKINRVSREGILQYLISKAVSLLDDSPAAYREPQPDVAQIGDSDCPAARPGTTSSMLLSGSCEQASDSSEDWSTVVAGALQAVRPVLLDCGGSQRLLLLVGCDAERSLLEPKIKAGHAAPLTTIVVPGIDPTLVCEAQSINLNDLRSRIMTATGGREDVLARLHSRCDIEWS